MLIGIINIVPKLDTCSNPTLTFSDSEFNLFDYRYELLQQKVALLKIFCMLLACRRAEDGDKSASNADLPDIVTDVKFVNIIITSSDLGIDFEYNSSSKNIDNILTIVTSFEKYIENIFFKEHESAVSFKKRIKKKLEKIFKQF